MLHKGMGNDAINMDWKNKKQSAQFVGPHLVSVFSTEEGLSLRPKTPRFHSMFSIHQHDT